MVKDHILSNCDQSKKVLILRLTYVFKYHMTFKGSRKLSKCYFGALNCFPPPPPHSLINSIYGGVCTSQNGGDKGQR